MVQIDTREKVRFWPILYRNLKMCVFGTVLQENRTCDFDPFRTEIWKSAILTPFYKKMKPAILTHSIQNSERVHGSDRHSWKSAILTHSIQNSQHVRFWPHFTRKWNVRFWPILYRILKMCDFDPILQENGMCDFDPFYTELCITLTRNAHHYVENLLGFRVNTWFCEMIFTSHTTEQAHHMKSKECDFDPFHTEFWECAISTPFYKKMECAILTHSIQNSETARLWPHFTSIYLTRNELHLVSSLKLCPGATVSQDVKYL